MTIIILLLDYYTRTFIDCLINSFFLCTLYNLHFDNFVLNEGDDAGIHILTYNGCF